PMCSCAPGDAASSQGARCPRITNRRPICMSPPPTSRGSRPSQATSEVRNPCSRKSRLQTADLISSGGVFFMGHRRTYLQAQRAGNELCDFCYWPLFALTTTLVVSGSMYRLATILCFSVNGMVTCQVWLSASVNLYVLVVLVVVAFFFAVAVAVTVSTSCTSYCSAALSWLSTRRCACVAVAADACGLPAEFCEAPTNDCAPGTIWVIEISE